MPGMNSGLNPADPTLVAAFRSALLHQGTIASMIIAFLWLLWITARASNSPVAVAGTEGSWRALPPVPAGAGTLAPGIGEYDAPAVSGSWLTVWRLAAPAWAKTQ